MSIVHYILFDLQVLIICLHSVYFREAVLQSSAAKHIWQDHKSVLLPLENFLLIKVTIYNLGLFMTSAM